MAVTSLCTLADVKARLQIPSLQTDQDAALDALRAGVEDSILDRTGFTFDPSVRTEDLIDVQLGVSRLLQARPINVAAGVSTQGRSMASQTFNPLLNEVRDAFRGRVLVLASELTPIFPPIGGLAPWFRWRQMIWPVVRVTYTPQPLGDGTGGTIVVPPALHTAAVEWTAFIAAKPGAGTITDISIEKVSESYTEKSAPAHVDTLLARFTRDMASHQF